MNHHYNNLLVTMPYYQTICYIVSLVFNNFSYQVLQVEPFIGHTKINIQLAKGFTSKPIHIILNLAIQPQLPQSSKL